MVDRVRYLTYKPKDQVKYIKILLMIVFIHFLIKILKKNIKTYKTKNCYSTKHVILLVKNLSGSKYMETFNNNRFSKKSCGIFIEFSIVYKIGYNNTI